MNGSGLPDRRTLERALRSAGLSARQSKKLIAGGWALLVGEVQAERDELRERLAELARALEDRTEDQ